MTGNCKICGKFDKNLRRGLCGKHYQRLRVLGDPLHTQKRRGGFVGHRKRADPINQTWRFTTRHWDAWLARRFREDHHVPTLRRGIEEMRRLLNEPEPLRKAS